VSEDTSTRRVVVLRDRVLVAIDSSAQSLGAMTALESARQMLREQRDRFTATVRVALVGRVSSGKSTLANALLGGYRVATGVEELTYNVNWLRYGEQPGLDIHFKDGAPAQRHELAELERMTVRARNDIALQRYLSRIDYIEVLDRNPYLREFDLVDTPGLDSHFSTDSANTLRFLGRSTGDVRDSTVVHASKADALVLVFTRGLAANEEDLLLDFQAAGFSAASPITTIGALTKVELYWPDQDPMIEGRRVADRIMKAAEARRLLYDLQPVASLVGAAAATVTDEEFADLTELALVPPQQLQLRASLGPLFTTRDYDDLPVPAGRRRTLFERFGGYGIVLACGLLRDGLDDPVGLRTELIKRSGLEGFRELLVEHFGNRADLIKLQRLIFHLQRLHPLFHVGLSPRERLGLDAAIAEVTQLEFTEHSFRELAVLRHHYNGELDLSEAEAAELLRVTGEHGVSLAARLGLAPDAPLAALTDQAHARLAYWAAFTADPSYGGPTRNAGQVIRRSYERLLHQAGEDAGHLGGQHGGRV
jgi:Dynamin family